MIIMRWADDDDDDDDGDDDVYDDFASKIQYDILYFYSSLMPYFLINFMCLSVLTNPYQKHVFTYLSHDTRQ